MAGPCRVFALAICIALSLPANASTEIPSYRIDATVTTVPPRIEGSAVIRFRNPTGSPLSTVLLLLFPNRFSKPDTAVDDFNRPYVYPEQEFSPGHIDAEVWVGDQDQQLSGASLPLEPVLLPTVCEGCVMQVRLPSPLAPGAVCTLVTRFKTDVPHRFGSFGEFNGQLTLVGGWYPTLAALSSDGWRLDAPPQTSHFDLTVSMPGELTGIVNGIEAPSRNGPWVLSDVVARYLTLVAAPRFERHTTVVGSTSIELLTVPQRLTSRISLEADPPELLLAALADAVEHAPVPLSFPTRTLIAVQAPLRLKLIAPSEGMLVISDRAMRVNAVLRPFHEQQIAQAVYAQWLRATGPRDDGRDGVWVTEGIAHVMADRYRVQRPRTRSVQEWIDLFNVFAIVDRFETAPKVPFVDALFERSPIVDGLHEQITTFNNDLPPGHVILDKLRAELGDEDFARLIDAYTAQHRSLREQLSELCGARCTPLLDQWIAAYPELNYSVASADLNQSDDHGFRHTVTVQRRSSRPIEEPVDVAIQSIGGELMRVRWDGHGDEARLVAETSQRAWRALIDPDRRLIETTRVDNAQPPEVQLVLDTAEVEISSTEFGFAALAVGRARYDYRKDIALAAIYTNRGIGAGLGPRLHWGPPIDANSYRHNLYGFYSLEALDRSFHEKDHPDVRSTGHINGLGLRYDYSDIFAYDNPTDSFHVRLFTDWYDGALGSDYNYSDWGASVSFTKPLFTPRTVFAGEMSSGFSHAYGNSRVPVQGQYSLGGSRSIRGIGAEEEIARNIFLLRAELRRAVYPEVDLNFLDLAVLRRAQLHLFVDSGQVDNSAGAVFDPSGYAVGVGTGLNFTYEFLGFFPSSAYLEIATRVDRSDSLGDVQVLFGSRQPF